MASEQNEDMLENGQQYNKFQLLGLVNESDSIDLGDQDDTSYCKSDEDKSDVNSEDVSKNPHCKNKSKSKSKSRRRRIKGKSIRKNQDQTEDIENDFQILNTNSSHYQPCGIDQPSIRSRFKMLKVELRNLQPEVELRKIFGKSVVKEDTNKQRNYPGSNLHRSKFVSYSYYEMKSGSSISGPKMEIDELLNDQLAIPDSKVEPAKRNPKYYLDFDSDCPIYFKFVHDKSYQEAHKLFLEAANRVHPESIVQNLSIYPTHVESLIQLSHMVRVSEDYKTASEFIERALLIYERGFHPKFNLATANCRISYRRPENRAFFIAIFNRILYCNRRGLKKTPLEYSKLLLSLEPENDPLLASQLIDFFSIRSEEYDFIIEFNARWTHLSKLPNMNFSVALAHFLKSRNARTSRVESEENLKLANECLRKALLLFPNFLIPLLDACAAEPSVDLKKCNYFDYSVYSNNYKLVPETIEVLVNLYVKRNFILWKPKHVLSWLEETVATMVSEFTTGISIDDNPCVHHWSEFKKPVPRNLLRHIVMSDLDLKIPPSAIGTTFLDIDPYPPIESIISYDLTPTSTQNPIMQASSSSFGASGLFLRSILPSFSFISQNHRTNSEANESAIRNGFSLGDYALDDGLVQIEAENEPSEMNQLQDSIAALVDTIVDLFRLSPLIIQFRNSQNSTSNHNGNNSNGQSRDQGSSNQ